MSAIASTCSRIWLIIINCWTYIDEKAAAIRSANNGLQTMITQAQPGILDLQWFQDTEAALTKAQGLLDQTYALIYARADTIIQLTPGPAASAQPSKR